MWVSQERFIVIELMTIEIWLVRLYQRLYYKSRYYSGSFFCDLAGTRTQDPPDKIGMLYQLSYQFA